MENNWIEIVDGARPDIHPDTPIDLLWADGDVWDTGEDKPKYCDFTTPSSDSDGIYITHYRPHNPEQSLDDAIGGSTVGAFKPPPEYVYPQTTFKPSSEAQLRSDEAARVNSLLSEKLSTISDIASKLTRKNFSVADIKLVKDLLESVEEYEENK